jgi:hypothetical protein
LSPIHAVPPHAFIFHTSRCGSTLFAKALAREPSNLVLVQPGPFQRGFWSAATRDFHEPLQADSEWTSRFRQLLLLMTRPREPRQKRVFVKFISWNVLYVDFIMRAFPEVPAIFLYRDPVEIVASVRQSSTAILEAKTARQAEFLTGLSRHAIDRLDAASYLATCYARFFETVTAWDNPRLSMVDYPALTSARFARILQRSFGYVPSAPALARMLVQFATYSKDDEDQKVFAADGEDKRGAVRDDDRSRIMGITEASLAALRRDPRNLFVSDPQPERDGRRQDRGERPADTVTTKDR